MNLIFQNKRIVAGGFIRMNRTIPALIIISLLFGCKKFVTVDPPNTQLVQSTVFESDATAEAAVVGIYSNMMASTTTFGSGSITLFTGLSGDEMLNYSSAASYIEIFQDGITVSNTNILGLWTQAYQYIYQANAIIEGLAASTSVSASTKSRLTAEAKFIRAFCYFYLVNLYGDVPLILSTNYQANEIATRTPLATIYQQCLSDLQIAQQDLPTDYSASGGERLRPNKWAASALLARIYLYTQKWAEAETTSSLLINNASTFALVSNPDSVFLANSLEAIWQLMPVQPGFNTPEGQLFILNDMPLVTALSSDLVDSFEVSDIRRADWIDSISAGTQTYFFPYKYKVNMAGDITEYYTVFRLAEQYLIRAEARNEQNNLSGALSDLNIIRQRAGLPYSNANDQSLIRMAIMHERKTELFCEWGHRWLDLKRTGQINAVLGTQKPNWRPSASLYPIPKSEIQNDPNLSQNPGY